MLGYGRNARGECLLQQARVNAASCAYGYDLRPGCALAPLFLQRDVHASADHLQHRSPLGCVRAVDNSFGAVNTARQLTHGLAQCFESQRLVGFVAPGAEDLRVVLPVVVVAIGVLAMEVVMTVGVGAVVLGGVR